MKHTLFLAFMLTIAGLLAPSPMRADTALEKLDTWGSNRGWEGVGYLVMDNVTSCTGTMIRPDLVLTAAHCLYNPRNGDRIDPRRIEFRAGWRGGKSIAMRFGKSAVIHPAYVEDAGNRISARQVRNDVALVQLADPILSTHADPFRTDRGIASGQAVSVVSYGKGRDDAPSRQRECTILDTQDGIVAMSCSVVPGSSGSPVFAMREGRPRVVAVVSAIGEVEGRDVSFAMDLERPLAEVMAAWNSGVGVFPAVANSARRLSVGSERTIGGARFIKP